MRRCPFEQYFGNVPRTFIMMLDTYDSFIVAWPTVGDKLLYSVITHEYLNRFVCTVSLALFVSH